LLPLGRLIEQPDPARAINAAVLFGARDDPYSVAGGQPVDLRHGGDAIAVGDRLGDRRLYGTVQAVNLFLSAG
jgi:hypothetical protein